MNHADTKGRAPLHWAAASGMLFHHNILLVANLQISLRNSVFFRLGKKKTADLLIKGGANVHAVDSTGKSALHWASQNGKENVAELLIKNGLSVDSLDKNMRTPLMIAAKNGNLNDSTKKFHAQNIEESSFHSKRIFHAV